MTRAPFRGSVGVLAWTMLATLVALTLAVPLSAQVTPQVVFVITVNTTDDDRDEDAGDGFCDTDETTEGEQFSLRAAIEEANAHPNDAAGPDIINFDIDTEVDPNCDADTGVCVIRPQELFTDARRLPSITDTVVIDGYTQDGASENTLAVGHDAEIKIVVDGSGTTGQTLTCAADDLLLGGRNAAGMQLAHFGPAGDLMNIQGPESSGTHIQGLNIRNSQADGISITEGSSDNVIRGNFIGTDETGLEDMGNCESGVFIESGSDNLVGGELPGDRNVISANGIALSTEDAGVSVGGSLEIVPVGIITAPPPNVGNIVSGNYIGTDATGLADLGNVDWGVLVSDTCATICVIAAGVPPDGEIVPTSWITGNVISGNGIDGVWIERIDFNILQDNLIGTDATGTADVGNEFNGVWILDSSGNLVGADAEGAGGNVIAFNGDSGVLVEEEAQLASTDGTTPSVANTIRGNSIDANGRLGIDLIGGDEDENGVTANDEGDAENAPDEDAGPNDLQNFPVIGVAISGSTAVAGSLTTTPSTTEETETYVIDFYASPACDASGFGEGALWLGSTTVETDENGLATFDVELDETGPPGWFLTATATNDLAAGEVEFLIGSTSEFSECVEILERPVIQFDSATYTVNEGDGTATIGLTRTGGTEGEVTVDYATSAGTATAGSDYTESSGTASFADGVTTASFTVPITDDTEDEGDETVNLSLSGPGGGAVIGTPDAATLSIIDNDGPPAIRFSSPTYSVVESEGPATITLLRSGSPDPEVTVDIVYPNTAGDPSAATENEDYTQGPGSVTFAAGETTRTFTIGITDDTDDEPDETVQMGLANPTGGASLGDPSQAVLTIVDDDEPAAEEPTDPPPTLAPSRSPSPSPSPTRTPGRAVMPDTALPLEGAALLVATAALLVGSVVALGAMNGRARRRVG